MGHLHDGGARHAVREGAVARPCARCPAASRSGWCSRRCCAARTRCCCSTSRTTTSTCRASAGSRSRCASRRRPCCSSATTASCWPARPPGSSRSSSAPAGTPPGPTAAASRRTTRRARERFDRLEELRRRWDEEHAKLKALVAMLQAEGGVQRRHGLALPGRADPAAEVRGGRPAARPSPGSRRSRCGCAAAAPASGRSSARALELTGLMKPFDLEVWYGERVAVLGSNGSGKSHFLRLLAVGGTDPEAEHRPVDDARIAPVAHTGRARLGARVRPGWFAQTHEHPELVGRTLLDILLARGRAPQRAGARGGVPGAATATSWRTPPSRRSTRCPAASRRGSRSCCWSSPAPPCCCWTSRPTTSTSSPPRRWRRAWRRSTARWSR